MRIRTVYDSRGGDKFYWETLLLAASWHRYVSDKAQRPLEVLVIGQPPRSLADFLAGLGASLREIAPHPLSRLVPTANKLQAVLDETRPTLLVDNDTLFVADWPQAADARGNSVRAALAGWNGLPVEVWEDIERSLGIAPPRRSWVPHRAALRAEIAGTEPQPQTHCLFNTGVLAFGSPAQFAALWAAHLQAIAGLGRGYHARGGGDQPGFATALTVHGGFSELPVTCNYRPVCFGLGLAPQGDIVVLHLSAFDFEQSLQASIRAYWSRRILELLPAGEARFAPRIRIAEEMRERALQLVADYALDRVSIAQ